MTKQKCSAVVYTRWLGHGQKKTQNRPQLSYKDVQAIESSGRDTGNLRLVLNRDFL